MKNQKRKTILLGEGIHQHTLVGDFKMEDKLTTFAPIKVQEKSVLRHEKPNGQFSNEHKALEVEKGNWVMGQQVEFNPFSQTVSRIWD